MTQSPIEQAIEALHDVVNGNICTVACLDALEALRQHQQDGGWLPISEAPIRKWCLVTNGNDTIIAYRDWEDEDWDGGSYGAYAEVMETIRIKNPTHWMPLPPAPKKENDDDSDR